MDRKKFLKNSILGTLALSVGQVFSNTSNKKIPTNNAKDTIGYNHLPNKENQTMNTILHKANTRGHADHGWLDAHHTFSFANYHNRDRMNFGVLRVLNDDCIKGGKGFGTHPHDNMEIITIPLTGALEHKDSIGNIGVIKNGEIQVMSAGKGIYHSEYNKNQDIDVTLLQIWVYPNKKNVSPRYDQISLKGVDLKNKFYQILSPNPEDDGVWIHQNAWFHLAEFDKGTNETYKLRNKDNGVYCFVINGDITIEKQPLNERDGFGIWEIESFDLQADSDTKILLMEVPLRL